MDIINPTTEEIIDSLIEDDKASLAFKFSILKKNQPAWSATKLTHRISILNKFVHLLKTNINALARTLTSEMGKPFQQSMNEINGACGRILWLTEHANQYLSEEVVTTAPGLQEKIIYEPLGVVCNISAWNYPYNVGINVFVPALLAGNAVMYKPSEFASLTGKEINKYLVQAGVPQEVFQLAIGSGGVGNLLLDLPFDGYFFTGSYKTGKYIYEKVASQMVPCQLELGGKDPVYIADDVDDIKSAAVSIADGAFYNNGQSCCAVERIYVHEKIYDQYLDEFIKEVKSWKIGDPQSDGVYISALSRRVQLDLIDDQVQDAVDKGGHVLTGGKRLDRKGYFYEPTVLTDVDHTMNIMKDESFGPIIGIMKVKNDEEALELMKDSEYGLTAAVYSSSWDRAQKILSQIDSGTGYWNCCDRVSPAVPWAGRKHSGIGVTLSHLGMRAFAKTKAYHLKGQIKNS